MQNKNTMMDFVWLLNAANNSAFETKSLYTQLLIRQSEFLEMKKNIQPDTPENNYLYNEFEKNLKSLEDMKKTLQEVIEVING